jgi:hypothetical protein
MGGSLFSEYLTSHMLPTHYFSTCDLSIEPRDKMKSKPNNENVTVRTTLGQKFIERGILKLWLPQTY